MYFFKMFIRCVCASYS